MDNQSIKKINFLEKFDNISEYWSPKIIGELNDYQFKIAKFKDGRIVELKVN